MSKKLEVNIKIQTSATGVTANSQNLVNTIDYV